MTGFCLLYAAASLDCDRTVVDVLLFEFFQQILAERILSQNSEYVGRVFIRGNLRPICRREEFEHPAGLDLGLGELRTAPCLGASSRLEGAETETKAQKTS